MDERQKFKQYLASEKKKPDYISKCGKLYDRLHQCLSCAPPTAELIGEFARGCWTGYTTRDKRVYEFLGAYADYSDGYNKVMADAILEHIKLAFEGLTKKAVRKYKREMVYIPDDTKIAPQFLEGLTNDEFVVAFRTWQEMVWAMYDEIEHGSPFEWGFPSWEAWTVVGVAQTRVMDIFQALCDCGSLINDTLVVDKKAFGKACKPMHMAVLTLNKFADIGLSIESLDDKKEPVFTISCHDTPNMITVIYSYFVNQEVDCIRDCSKCMKKHWYNTRDFSYRYVEASERLPQETYYLAHTEGAPNDAREIYDYLHDEAAKHGFVFQGEFMDGGLLYKKGGKKWLLAGSGSSYHEVDYLFDPDYEIAIKVQFKRIFDENPGLKEILTQRFPQMINRKRSICWKCREECKKRVHFEVEGVVKHYCNTFVFANPTLDDVKFLLELYKEENRIIANLT